MSYAREQLQFVGSSTADLTSTGDKLTFTPSTPVEVYEWGFIVTTAATASDGFTLAADKRVTAGSDTGRGTADGGTITIAAASSSGYTAGTVCINRITPLVINPGEQLIIELTASNTALFAFLYINYREARILDRSVVTVVTS